MKLLELTQQGIAHFIVPLAVIVGVAVVGVGYLVISHADPLPTTTNSSNWKLLQSATNKETTMSLYACKDNVSSTETLVNAKGTLSPAVSDSSKYTIGIDVGTAGHGGASTTNVWTNHATASTQAGANPQLKESVTPIFEGPTADPFTQGGGGGSQTVASLPKCS